MRRIEALALVVAKYSGGFDPASEGFRLCNPGSLRVFSNRTMATMSPEGLRRFKSWTDGLRALVFDLQVKCGGGSRTHVKPDATLKDLLGMWEMRVPRKAVTFLRRALQDETIQAWTPVGWFLEDRAIGPSGHGAIEEHT